MSNWKIMSPAVVLIDTNPAVQAIAELALGKAGYVVKSIAASGAVEYIQREKPAVVLCANTLPGFDPFALCEFLKAQPDLCNIRFVVFAPKSDEKLLQPKVSAANIDALLLKPFSSSDLLHLVQQLLARSDGIPPSDEVTALTALVVLPQGLLRQGLILLLEKLGFSVQATSSLSSTPENEVARFRLSFVALKCLDGSEFRQWENYGEIFFIGEAEQRTNIPHTGAKFMQLPLTTSQLYEALASFVQIPGHHSNPITMITEGEQERLAAEISATVFEELLQHPALRELQWQEVSTLATDAVRRVQKDFEQKK